MSGEQIKPGYKRTEIGVIPTDWGIPLLDSIAKRGSGHTPDKKHPEYWNGRIKWISLKDSDALDNIYIEDTAATITEEGIANSSAVLHPAGTVVLSRDAGVGKSAIMKTDMAVSQHFMAWQCGSELNNVFLYYWLQATKPEFERIAIGNTIKTIGLPFFKTLRVPQPHLKEQRAIASVLLDVDTLLAKLDRLIAKKSDIKKAAMQQLLTGQTRLPGFSGEWEVNRIASLGTTYGGLAGKTKNDFGRGQARYIPFMNVMTDTVIDPNWLEQVDVTPSEAQNTAKRGDLFFNGSSETPEEVGYCSVLLEDIPNLYLNSFCFGFRFNTESKADGLFFAYWFRSELGRKAMLFLAQGATRYNISKGAFLQLEILLPPLNEQNAIAIVLSEIDTEITALEARRDKIRDLKQGMMQELLTGRIRLV